MKLLSDYRHLILHVVTHKCVLLLIQCHYLSYKEEGGGKLSYRMETLVLVFRVNSLIRMNLTLMGIIRSRSRSFCYMPQTSQAFPHPCVPTCHSIKCGSFTLPILRQDMLQGNRKVQLLHEVHQTRV